MDKKIRTVRSLSLEDDDDIAFDLVQNQCGELKLWIIIDHATVHNLSHENVRKLQDFLNEFSQTENT